MGLELPDAVGEGLAEGDGLAAGLVEGLGEPLGDGDGEGLGSAVLVLRISQSVRPVTVTKVRDAVHAATSCVRAVWEAKASLLVNVNTPSGESAMTSGGITTTVAATVVVGLASD